MWDRSTAYATEPTPAAEPHDVPAGKRTLTQLMPARSARGSEPPPVAPAAVQRRLDLDAAWTLHLAGGSPTATTDGDPRAIAARGMSGTPTALPHGEVIQRAFGRHDVSHTPAYVGGAATEASAALGARAYAADGQVAFAQAPDLFTAAHEAAHVVQQRTGVQLAGGVGAAGDRYEAHADRVAAAVVAGASAEAILDEHAGTGGLTGVQRAEATTAPAAAPTATAAPGAAPTTAGKDGAFAVALTDLQAKGKQVLAGLVASAAPQPGTSLSIEAMVRVPVYPPLNASGELGFEVEHADDGITITASGGLGLSIGEGGAFADLMGTSSFSGKGADATRAVEMLVLAMESYVRAIPDSVFMVGPGLGIVTLAVLVQIAASMGRRPADLIADGIWGKGHAAAVIAAMRDGEQAEFSAGGKFAGSVDEGGAGVEGSAGLEGKRTIAKEDGQVTTEDALILAMDGTVEVNGISGGFELEVPLTAKGAGTLTLTAAGSVDAKLLGGLSKYALAATNAFGQARSFIAGNAPSAPDAAARARAADGTLATAQQVVPGAINGAADLVAHALAEEGVGGAEGSLGLEASLELDLGAKRGTLTFAATSGVEAEIPGDYGEGEITKKTTLVTIPVPMG